MHAAWLTTIALSLLAADEKLFQAEPMPAEGFTAGIEGPACDADGNIFVVAFQQPENIGRVTPEGKAELFLTLPNKSYGNGIVFDRAGQMFVADYTNHNVLKVDPQTKAISVLVHEPRMNQPNDLAIGPDGTLYASDPSWPKGSARFGRSARKASWRVAPTWERPTASRSARTARRCTSTSRCSGTSGRSI